MLLDQKPWKITSADMRSNTGLVGSSMDSSKVAKWLRSIPSMAVGFRGGTHLPAHLNVSHISQHDRKCLKMLCTMLTQEATIENAKIMH